jgi:N-acetylglutamate synthase-like GNAT family acetyltransferase
MNYEIVVPDRNHLQKTEEISQWMKSSQTMLVKTPGELANFFTQGRSVLLSHENTTIAHAALTYLWSKDFAEGGGVVVNPEYRGQGYGHLVVNALLWLAGENFPDKKLFALCNQYSLNLFLHAGGQIITDPNFLPSEVWGECIKCPTRGRALSEHKLCCDTPVLMKK